MDRRTFKAVSALVGTTIGAGIFGIPYAFFKGGLSLCILYLLTLTIVNLILNLVYGEIILKTKGDHQLAGYAEIYLGKKAKTFTTIAQMAGLFGALLAYVILAGDFFSLLLDLPQYTSLFSISFAILGSLILLFGLKTVSKIESMLFILLISLPVILILSGLPQIDLNNYNLPPTNAFLPYGVFLFSLSGPSVIPVVEEILIKKRRQLPKAITLGTIIPTVVYFIFGAGILGISGQLTSEDALSGLQTILGPNILKLGSILGIIAVLTSFLTLSFVLRELFHRDLKISKSTSWGLISLIPLLLYLLGFKSFIEVIGFTGAILMGTLGIIIVLIYQKVSLRKKGSEIQIHLPWMGRLTIMIIFASGIIFELLSFFKIL